MSVPHVHDDIIPAMRRYYAYIMASRTRRLYIGVTSNLLKRVWQHKHGTFAGFTARYNVDRLVFFEETSDVRAAIAREKKLEAWPRARKVRLIEKANAGWLDLSVAWFAERPTTAHQATHVRGQPGS